MDNPKFWSLPWGKPDYYSYHAIEYDIDNNNYQFDVFQIVAMHIHLICVTGCSFAFANVYIK